MRKEKENNIIKILEKRIKECKEFANECLDNNDKEMWNYYNNLSQGFYMILLLFNDEDEYNYACKLWL